MCSISLITSFIDFILIRMNTVSFAVGNKPTVKETTINYSWIAFLGWNYSPVVAFFTGVRADNMLVGFLFHDYLLLFLMRFFWGGHNRGSHLFALSVHSPK